MARDVLHVLMNCSRFFPPSSTSLIDSACVCLIPSLHMNIHEWKKNTDVDAFLFHASIKRLYLICMFDLFSRLHLPQKMLETRCRAYKTFENFILFFFHSFDQHFIIDEGKKSTRPIENIRRNNCYYHPFVCKNRIIKQSKAYRWTKKTINALQTYAIPFTTQITGWRKWMERKNNEQLHNRNGAKTKIYHLNMCFHVEISSIPTGKRETNFAKNIHQSHVCTWRKTKPNWFGARGKNIFINQFITRTRRKKEPHESEHFPWAFLIHTRDSDTTEWMRNVYFHSNWRYITRMKTKMWRQNIDAVFVCCYWHWQYGSDGVKKSRQCLCVGLPLWIFNNALICYDKCEILFGRKTLRLQPFP